MEFNLSNQVLLPNVDLIQFNVGDRQSHYYHLWDLFPKVFWHSHNGRCKYTCVSHQYVDMALKSNGKLIGATQRSFVFIYEVNRFPYEHLKNGITNVSELEAPL